VAHGAKRRKCSVEGCDKNIKKEGKCSMHGWVTVIVSACYFLARVRCWLLSASKIQQLAPLVMSSFSLMRDH
jgi:hypothetical protein